MNYDSLHPLDSQKYLESLLREQDETADDILELVPILQRLSEWEAPKPSPADTQHLLFRLTTLLLRTSPIRLAVQKRRQDALGRLLSFFEVARTQVNILLPSFWLLSALITFFGVLVVCSIPSAYEALVLRALGPFLAYFGTINAFRGIRMGMLEFELSCPPSPQQLTLARLIIVLGYDVILVSLGCIPLWIRGDENFLSLILLWLMPLLLVTGLALLLSLHHSITMAAGLAYGCWLALDISIMVLTLHVNQASPYSLTIISAVMTGIIGLGLLFIALRRFKQTVLGDYERRGSKRWNW